MKILLLSILAITYLNAGIIIEQNIKALYRDVNLSKEETNYIIDNKDKNIASIQETSKKYIQKIKNSSEEKNVIEFTLTKEQKKENINFLKRSDTAELNEITKEIILNTNFVKNTQDIKMRFIFVYDFGNKKNIYIQKSNAQNNEPYEQNIPKGTTRFDYSTQEYVRVFETQADGFIEANVNPNMCAQLKVLTYKNQRIQTGYAWWELNGEILKGKYKLLVKTSKDCDVNIQYP